MARSLPGLLAVSPSSFTCSIGHILSEAHRRGHASPPVHLSARHPAWCEAARTHGEIMSTGSLSDVDDELLDGILKFGSSNESAEESSNCEGGSVHDGGADDDEGPGKKRRKTSARKTTTRSGAGQQEGKHVQRNAANARERARMRVLSKAFSRLKTTLPWVPPDTKLSKLDTLRLASSYIQHLRQILANDKYEKGYIHPVNLTWPFMVAGKPENDLKEMLNATRLCGTAS